MRRIFWILFLIVSTAVASRGEDVTIRIDARGPGRPVSRYLTGACLEDVNHEVYGGIYSQMIFGESFQEPPSDAGAVRGFSIVDGSWQVKDRELLGPDGPGPEGPQRDPDI